MLTRDTSCWEIVSFCLCRVSHSLSLSLFPNSCDEKGMTTKGVTRRQWKTDNTNRTTKHRETRDKARKDRESSEANEQKEEGKDGWNRRDKKEGIFELISSGSVIGLLEEKDRKKDVLESTGHGLICCIQVIGNGTRLPWDDSRQGKRKSTSLIIREGRMRCPVRRGAYHSIVPGLPRLDL